MSSEANESLVRRKKDDDDHDEESGARAMSTESPYSSGRSNADDDCMCTDLLVIRSSLEDQKALSRRHYCWPRYVGGNILICGRKRSRFPYQCFVGPDWPCMLVTYALIITPTIPFLLYIAFPIHTALGVIACLTFAATILSFSTAACSDPGIIYRVIDDDCRVPSDDAEVALVECSICDMRRPINAHHCQECGLCIEDLDHHCPWTGKCIGKRTIWYFQAFLTTLFIHAMLVLGTILVAMMTASVNEQ